MTRFGMTSVLALIIGASACATTAPASAPTTARFEMKGLASQSVAVDEREKLQFQNSDQKPHQIYSNDCPELSSPIIEPGQMFASEVGNGPKVCHFEDLLDPKAPGFRGTVDVKAKKRVEPVYVDSKL